MLCAFATSGTTAAQGCNGDPCIPVKAQDPAAPPGWTRTWADTSTFGKGLSPTNPCTRCKKCEWAFSATFVSPGDTGETTQCGNTTGAVGNHTWCGTFKENCNDNHCLSSLILRFTPPSGSGGSASLYDLSCGC